MTTQQRVFLVVVVVAGLGSAAEAQQAFRFVTELDAVGPIVCAAGDPSSCVQQAQLEPVTGAPFMAEAVTEFRQVLGDGNRIEHTYTATIARDSRGRSRREQDLALLGPLAPLGDAPPRLVTIIDPSREVTYTLDGTNRAAYVTRVRWFGDSPAANVSAGRNVTAVHGTRVDLLGPVPSGQPMVFTGVSGQVVAGLPPMNGVQTPPAMAVTSLGTSQIEGVTAEGTRTTMTIAAGAIGNISPIEIVTERWVSKELGMAVRITRTDPRSGDTVYRLTNIVRAEPPPDLFEVPPDYTVHEPAALRMTTPAGANAPRAPKR